MSQIVQRRSYLRWLAGLLIALLAYTAMPGVPAFAVVLEGDAPSSGATAPPARGTEGSLLGGGVPAATPADEAEITYDNPGDASIGASSSWIGTGAAHALEWALRKLDPGAPQLLGSETEQGTWFTEQYSVMRAMGIWVMVPLVLIAIIHSIAKGSMEMLLKSVLIYLPLSILGTVVAVEIIDGLLNVTDDISAVFAESIAKNSDAYWTNVLTGFREGEARAGGDIINMIVGILMLVVCVTMYIILVLREASIYIGTAFLPIGFAMLVWPATAGSFRKLCEFLFAMIFSKVVIVAGVSLAIAGIAGTTGDGTSNDIALAGNQIALAGSSGNGDANSDSQWLFMTLQAIVMMAVVSVSPMALTKMAGNIGFDGASNAMDQMLNRPGLANQIIMANRLNDIRGNAVGTGKALHEMPKRREEMKLKSPEDLQLERLGAKLRTLASGDQNYHISEAELQAVGIDATEAALLASMSESMNPDEIAIAHTALRLGVMYGGYNDRGGYTSVRVKNSNGTTSESVNLVHTRDAAGRRLDHIEPALIRRIADEERRAHAAAGNPHAGVRILSHLNTNNPSQLKNAQNLSGAADQYRRQNNVNNVRVMFQGELIADRQL